MSNPKPLSYGVLQVILQHVEPILRFRLAHHLPSIQNAEKLAPMLIKTLEIKASAIQIDGVSFSLEIMEYHRNCIPRLNTLRNWFNPAKMLGEVDKYGIRLPPMESLTPGDIVIGDFPREITEEDDLNKLHHIIQSREGRNVAIWQHFIEKYRRRKENLEPTSQLFLVLKTQKDNLEHREALVYRQNLGAAMKYLTGKLLGGRSLKIKNLELCGGDWPVFRFPIDLKLNVQNLEVSGIKKNLNAVQSILCPLSFPLRSISVDQFTQADSEFLKSAKLLINRENFVIPRHRRVHLPHVLNIGRGVQVLIRKWQREAPKVETHVSFAMFATDVESVAKVLEKNPEEFLREGSIVPLNKDWEIHIYTSDNTIDISPIVSKTLLLNLKIQHKNNIDI